MDSLSPLAKKYPQIFGDKQATIIYLAIRAEAVTDSCQAMNEAKQVVQSATMEKMLDDLLIACSGEEILALLNTQLKVEPDNQTLL